VICRREIVSKDRMRYMKKYYTYILEGYNHRYYIGYTNDMARRLEEHRTGKGGRYTTKKFKGRLLLRYMEEFNTREKAEKRELQIKGWTRKKKEALIYGSKNDLTELAKKKFINLKNPE